jgi:Molybdopterin biosynthesis enzyme
MLIPLQEARNIIQGMEVKRPPHVKLPLQAALGKICASKVVAEIDLPPHNMSAMDGYAVRSEDVGKLRLKLKGKIFPSGGNIQAIQSGEVAYVATGAPLPAGADAVVRAEGAKLEGDILQVSEIVYTGKDVRTAGDDVRKADTVLDIGVQIRPTHLGVLTALNIDYVDVYMPRIAVVSIGDELLPFNSKEAVEGKSRDAIGRVVVELLSQLGEVSYLGVVRDSIESISNVLMDSSKSFDLVITVGGSSIGEKDYVKAALSKVGTLLFEGVTVNIIKRGAVGLVNGTPILVLPGQAVAAAVTLAEHGRRILSRMMNSKLYRTETVSLAKDIKVEHKMDSLYLFSIEDGVATPLRWGAGLYSVLGEADGYAVLRRGELYRSGERIQVYRLV